MSTVFLLMDAFRRDYLSEDTTPFLWKCAQEGEHYEGVVQSLGFCERTEILTGMRGDESGFFTAIGFEPSVSPYTGVKALPLFHVVEQFSLAILKFTPPLFASKVHRRLRYYAQRYLHRRGITMPSFLIPYPWLKYFALTEDRVDLREPNLFSSPSIFDLLSKSGKTYFYDSFTALGLATPYATDQDRLDGVVQDLAKNPKDLYLVYVSIPDVHGHRCGPDSGELQGILRKMDQMIERFVGQAEEAAPLNRYLFLGDHGMLRVTSHFDGEKEIESVLRKSGLKKGKDLVYFLDSTMVRFWLMSKRARDILPTLLEDSLTFSSDGSWMNAEAAGSNHVPWPDRRYGDLLWVANPGVLVFPDFFRRIAPCKGMHGYDPNLPESQGACVLWGKDIEPQTRAKLALADVFDLLKRTLNV